MELRWTNRASGFVCAGSHACATSTTSSITEASLVAVDAPGCTSFCALTERANVAARQSIFIAIYRSVRTRGRPAGWVGRSRGSSSTEHSLRNVVQRTCNLHVLQYCKSLSVHSDVVATMQGEPHHLAPAMLTDTTVRVPFEYCSSMVRYM